MQSFRVERITQTGFEKVPRATLTCANSRVDMDYHADLCPLQEGETVEMGIYTSGRPQISKNTYLTRGIVYKVGEGGFEASFGGLLMFYEGRGLEQVGLESEIYVSVDKRD